MNNLNLDSEIINSAMEVSKIETSIAHSKFDSPERANLLYKLEIAKLFHELMLIKQQHKNHSKNIDKTLEELNQLDSTLNEIKELLDYLNSNK